MAIFSLGGRRVHARAVGPIEVFDKEPDWHSVWWCHLCWTDRRRQTGPNGIG